MDPGADFEKALVATQKTLTKLIEIVDQSEIPPRTPFCSLPEESPEKEAENLEFCALLVKQKLDADLEKINSPEEAALFKAKLDEYQAALDNVEAAKRKGDAAATNKAVRLLIAAAEHCDNA